jgi:hypothetical protein
MKFIACNNKSEFVEAAGFDWYKILKVDGGYIGFTSQQEYQTWLNQK